MSKALLLLRRAVAACSIKAMVVPRFFLLSRLAASSSRSKLSLIPLASSHPYSGALHTPHAPQSEPFPAHKNASFKFAPGETLTDLFLPPGVDVGAAAGLRRLAWSNVFVDPHAGQGLVREARFIKSSTKEQDCPQEGFPEFALVGHSNAGKSSLLNALVRRRKLANTSGRAGKTQVINHFLINRSWYMVDLPGYGSARAPTNVRKEWENFTKDYFLQRKNLVSVLLLVDASRLTKQLDLDYADWLLSRKIPITIVFTKCDKNTKKSERKSEKNVLDFKKQLKVYFDKMPPWIMTSCVTNQGQNELLIHLAQLRSYWESNLWCI